MLNTSDLDYCLPADRIAIAPAMPRDSARMLVVSRRDPELLIHARVRDLPAYLQPGDRMVTNTTRVLPARFLGRRVETSGKVEGLYLGIDPASESDPTRPLMWQAMIKSRRHKPGMRVELFNANTRSPSLYQLELVERLDEPAGAWRVVVLARSDDAVGQVAGGEDAVVVSRQILDVIGMPPLPPYILAARHAQHLDRFDPADSDRYQTVYADEPVPGSVAAPTAGLHFTPSLLEALRAGGIERSDVILDVGAGTFKPVETQTVEAHPIHAERCSMDARAVEAILTSRAAGHRICAVGTTSVRTIESYARLVAHGTAIEALPRSMSTELLITPGFHFAWTDCLLTNFHLPRSSLMALVAAFLEVDVSSPDTPHPGSSGVERLKMLYAKAIEADYRFYSFGDCMLILP